VTGTRTVSYAAFTRRITAVAGNDITVDTAISTGFSGQTLFHDDGPAMQAAVNATTAGKVVYAPAGTYQIETAVFIQPSKDEITIRGAGPGQTIFYGVGLQSKLFTVGSGFGDTTLRTVTGAKTKATGATSTLELSAVTGFTLAHVWIENEEDNTRIQAGAAPTWSQSAFRKQRQMIAQVTAVGASSVTLAPGLPWDCTNYVVEVNYNSGAVAEKVGFEDFSISFDPRLHPETGIVLTGTVNCWVSNIETPDWSSNTSAGQLVNLQYSCKAEIRHNKATATTTSSSDGVVQILYASSCLIEDNIALNFDTFIYEYGKVTNCVYGFNFGLNAQTGSKFGFNQHNAHPSLVLMEGNIIPNYQTDGYHGSASHNTAFRNWFHGTNVAKTLAGFVISLKRFTRRHVHAFNILGWDGFNGAGPSYGQPNIGNSSSVGTAQPTAGDFWDHWGRTGTLDTRTSDSACIVTVSGGDWTSVRTSGGLVSLVWGGKTLNRANMVISANTGTVITLTGGSGAVLPAEGSTFDIVQPNIIGFQELDEDVEDSTTDVHNYQSSLAGTGAITDSTTETPPDSLYYTARPWWWPTSLAWPALNPDSPSFSFEAIPAGYRYVHGVDPGSASSAPAHRIRPTISRRRSGY
jgi:hypothetical protein